MEALIRTKFYIPQVQPNWVARPRLVDLLSEGVERSLTLISAPPGFGKTTLLSEWAAAGARNTRGKRLPVAWLSLDERDNQPGRFGTYLLAALSALHLRVDPSHCAAPGSDHPPLELLLTTLINQIAGSAAEPDSPLHGGFVLVLDDHHYISAPAVHDGLALLLTHLPPQMHVIIASRVDPILPLAQLRARGQLAELRASDLRFQPEEIKTFLNQKMGLNLSAEAVSTLDARTEGWAAALQLAALAMQNMTKAGGLRESPAAFLSAKSAHGGQTAGGAGSPTARREPVSAAPLRGLSETPEFQSAFIRDFTGNHRYIVDYLAEQVLNQQPAHIQEFLLATSILDRLSGPLCEAVLGDDRGWMT